MADPYAELHLDLTQFNKATKEKTLGSLDEMNLLDKRDSLSNPGFISYGFGRYGGYRSRYGWKNRRRLSEGKTAESSKAGQSGSIKERKSQQNHDGLAGWWKPQDNPVG